jgi:hypothetical protein
MTDNLMTVRLTTYLSGHGIYAEPGQEVTLPASVAQRLIATGQAELVQREVETHSLDTSHRSPQRRRLRPPPA